MEIASASWRTSGDWRSDMQATSQALAKNSSSFATRCFDMCAKAPKGARTRAMPSCRPRNVAHHHRRPVVARIVVQPLVFLDIEEGDHAVVAVRQAVYCGETLEPVAVAGALDAPYEVDG